MPYQATLVAQKSIQGDYLVTKLKLKAPYTKVNLEKEEEQIDSVGSRRGVLFDEVLQQITEEITAACKAACMTGKITYKIHSRNPADEIINLSNIMHFDLIIMGSRRITSRVPGIGSTTRKVASTLRIPLLIVQKQPRYKDEW